jgi:hypothetical protein
MRKIIKLTESDLEQIIKKVLNEQTFPGTSSGEQMGYRERSTPSKPQTKAKEDINPKKLKLGDGGNKSPKLIPDVKILQQKLMDLGLLKTDTMVPTGYFGPKTDTALKLYYAPKPEVQQKEKPDTKKEQKAAECETGTSKVLDPNSSLRFNGDELQWISSGSVVKTWTAISGLTFKNTPVNQWNEMLNRYTKNPEEWAKDPNAGPIPPGNYLVGPLETRGGNLPEISAIEALWLKVTGQVSDSDKDRQFCKNTPLSRISWGNYRLPITPDKGNQMYGRGSFYVHGGSLKGSHGCIDLTDDMEDFAKFFGIWSASTKKTKIPLVVNYKLANENTFFAKLGKLFK